MTLLCDIGFKYKTDKCPKVGHTYTPYYYEIFKDKRNSIKKVFEMGIGYLGSMERCSGADYTTGASLYVWREFFPNAQIYGADIAKEALFETDRIKTFLCDQRNKEDVERVMRMVGTDIDLFIDDGAHYFSDQVFLCKTVMPLLKKDVIYVIEDVCFPNKLVKALSKYNCFVPKLDKPLVKYRNNLVVVRNKV